MEYPRRDQQFVFLSGHPLRLQNPAAQVGRVPFEGELHPVAFLVLRRPDQRDESAVDRRQRIVELERDSLFGVDLVGRIHLVFEWIDRFFGLLLLLFLLAGAGVEELPAEFQPLGVGPEHVHRVVFQVDEFGPDRVGQLLGGDVEPEGDRILVPRKVFRDDPRGVDPLEDEFLDLREFGAEGEDRLVLQGA